MKEIFFKYRLNDEEKDFFGSVPMNDDTSPYKDFGTTIRPQYDHTSLPTHDFISLPRPFQENQFNYWLEFKQQFIERHGYFHTCPCDEHLDKIDGICQTMFAQMNGEATITEDLKTEYLLKYGE